GYDGRVLGTMDSSLRGPVSPSGWLSTKPEQLQIFIERHVSSISTLDDGFDESWAPPGKKNSVYGEDKKD
ncbi:hypothetical protein ACFYRV_00005, partial [Streptomyces scopuliridis]